MKKNTILLIDFDSTFVTIESLTHLAEMVLREKADKHKIVDEIMTITQLGMEGKIGFSESLKKDYNFLSQINDIFMN